MNLGMKLGAFEFLESLGHFENTSCLLLSVKKLKHFQTPLYVLVLLFLIQYFKMKK